MRFNHF
ncbi:hypothetical protein D043_4923A, partial [Vibrio parahaemolyticus EKP-021]